LVVQPGLLLGLADGEVDCEGLAEAEADCEGVWLGEALGLLLPVTVPVQVVPLRVKLAGTALVPEYEPLNPKLVVPLVPIDPLYDRLETDTLVPDCV
jgi:hypothetical protein